MNHRPFKSSEPCARCGKAPRRPHSDHCGPCREDAVKEYQNTYHREVRKKKARQTLPCKCGCGVGTIYPARYATEDCKLKGRTAAIERTNEQRRRSRSKKLAEKEAVKPLTAAQIAAKEAEQQRLDAEASARDRAWHALFMKEKLGLESAPGKPLASKVVTPPKEVWRELEKQYKPQRDTEKFAWVPCRGDISY
jgi:hypothetical protein